MQSFLQRLIWKDTAEIRFSRIYKNKTGFGTNDGAEQNTNTTLSNSIDNQTAKNHFSHYKVKKNKNKSEKAAKADIISIYIQEEAMKP